MPATIVPNEGELVLLDYMLRLTTNNDEQVLRLFQNDVTPDQDTTDGTFTEANFQGYESVTLVRGDWDAATTNQSGRAESRYSNAPLTFTCTGTGNTIYGYWVETADPSPTVLYAQKFDNMKPMGNGDSLNINPIFSISGDA